MSLVTNFKALSFREYYFLKNLFENEETSGFAIETFFAHYVLLEVCANCNVQYEFARKVWWDKQWLGAAKPFFLAVVD